MFGNLWWKFKGFTKTIATFLLIGGIMRGAFGEFAMTASVDGEPVVAEILMDGEHFGYTPYMGRAPLFNFNVEVIPPKQASLTNKSFQGTGRLITGNMRMHAEFKSPMSVWKKADADIQKSCDPNRDFCGREVEDGREVIFCLKNSDDCDGDGDPNSTDCDPCHCDVRSGAPDRAGDELDSDCDGSDSVGTWEVVETGTGQDIKTVLEKANYKFVDVDGQKVKMIYPTQAQIDETLNQASEKLEQELWEKKTKTGQTWTGAVSVAIPLPDGGTKIVIINQ